MKNSLSTVIALALLVGLFGTVGAQTKLTMIGHWDTTSEQYQYFRAAADEYQALNPGITIEFNTESTNTASGIAKMLTLLAGGLMPDIVHMNSAGAIDLVVAGVFAPPPPELQQRIAQFFFPQVVPGVEMMGQIYGIPTENQVTGFYHNIRMQQEAGLPGVAPATWDEWREHMRRTTIRDAEGNVLQYGTGMREPHLTFFTLLFSNGGTYMEGDQIGFSREPAIEATQFFLEAAELGWNMVTANPPNGRTATMILPSYFIRNLSGAIADDIAAGLIGTGLPPAGPNGTPTSFRYGWGLFVSAVSDHQKEAWDFLSWWGMEPGPDGITRLGKQMMLLSLPSNPNDLAQRPELIEDPWYSGFIQSLSVGKEENKPYPGVQSRHQILINNFRAAVRGQVPVVEAIDRALSEIQIQVQQISASMNR